MTIINILLQFLLLISLEIHNIACIFLFSGCQRYLEASQLIYGVNRLTGSCVMRISIEGYFRAICKVTFYVSRIFLLLPDLCVVLVLIFVIYIICLVYLMLCCFSSLVSVNVVSKSLGRFGCFDRRSTFIDVDSWSLQLVLVILF